MQRGLRNSARILVSGDYCLDRVSTLRFRIFPGTWSLGSAGLRWFYTVNYSAMGFVLDVKGFSSCWFMQKKRFTSTIPVIVFSLIVAYRAVRNKGVTRSVLAFGTVFRPIRGFTG